MPHLLHAIYRPPHAVAYAANGYTFWMVPIRKGRLGMGEERKYQIELAHDYELGQFPVTQALWRAVMEENPAHFKGQDRPVEQVNIADVELFLDRLNTLPEIAAHNAADGRRFRLPSEAQWEYAARGGRYEAAFDYPYAGSAHLPEVGWYDENSHNETQTVGRKRPNALGLYEMSGNVDEWCESIYHIDDTLKSKDGDAVQGENIARRRSLGGFWDSISNDCQLFSRYGYVANARGIDSGFRLARY